jgi:hypothetical protein
VDKHDQARNAIQINKYAKLPLWQLIPPSCHNGNLVHIPTCLHRRRGTGLLLLPAGPPNALSVLCALQRPWPGSLSTSCFFLRLSGSANRTRISGPRRAQAQTRAQAQAQATRERAPRPPRGRGLRQAQGHGLEGQEGGLGARGERPAPAASAPDIAVQIPLGLAQSLFRNNRLEGSTRERALRLSRLSFGRSSVTPHSGTQCPVPLWVDLSRQIADNPAGAPGSPRHPKQKRLLSLGHVGRGAVLPRSSARAARPGVAQQLRRCGRHGVACSPAIAL